MDTNCSAPEQLVELGVVIGGVDGQHVQVALDLHKDALDSQGVHTLDGPPVLRRDVHRQLALLEIDLGQALVDDDDGHILVILELEDLIDDSAPGHGLPGQVGLVGCVRAQVPATHSPAVAAMVITLNDPSSSSPTTARPSALAPHFGRVGLRLLCGTAEKIWVSSKLISVLWPEISEFLP